MAAQFNTTKDLERTFGGKITKVGDCYLHELRGQPGEDYWTALRRVTDELAAG